MIRPIDTAAVSRSELAELLGARQERVGGRHGGVEADLLGDRLHPVGVVVVGDQHDRVGVAVLRGTAAVARSDSQVLVPSTSLRSASSGTPWSRR